MGGFKLLLLFLFCLICVRSGGQLFSSAAESVDHQQEEQVFGPHRPVNDTTKDFDVDKRKVPTGSNPLHNKRR
ncbi:hypothetical protein DCAR_0522596 [Daucus carota subsp. sativus]|uniref:Uncharacterized protein n=1 Tax=Daucus carota subsp. sativus TaxID=79200 RepID=A0AAF1B211_DAUCS|nr:hypothetical protein DCAR_0522596 [Daucus carota subsp. sativus]